LPPFINKSIILSLSSICISSKSLCPNIFCSFSPKGKSKIKKPKFHKGYYPSNKNGGKEMYYRSRWECEVYECLERLNEVAKYDAEPFSVKYTFNGKVHEYNPDLSILKVDGKIEIWEIKPQNQTELPKNEAKWVACNNYCQSRGWEFIVLTENGIAQLKKKVQDQQLTSD